MESWITHIGTAPIATAFVGLCAAIVLMARHIVRQQDQRIEDQKATAKELRDLTVATSAALSSTAQAMTAAGAGMNSAREAMQVATAIMERTSR